MTLLPTIRTVAIKELREIVRDRRALLLMIVLPVFLYPALFVLMEQVMLFGQETLSGSVPTVGMHSEPGVTAPGIAVDEGDPGFHLVPLPEAGPADVASGLLDAVIRVDSVGPPEARTLGVDLYYDASRDQSVRARALLLNELSRLGETTLEERLREMGLPPEFARPIEVRDTSVATARVMGGVALGRILPMVLILMTILGAFHPAIDIAAGERERRTLEPLLTSSVPAAGIVLGKYFAVALIAFLAAALNLGSVLFTLNAGVFQLADELGFEFSLPLGTVILTLGLLVLLALLFSSLFLGIAVQAQSFREAQTMLTPVYIMSFVPAIVTMAPGVELSEGLAIVPIAGISLLFRALMAGDAVGVAGLFAVGATAFYAGAALSFAIRAFEREDVLIGGDERAEVRSARLPWWNADGAAVPSPPAAILFTGLVGVLFFYAGSIFAGAGEAGILASQWLLIAVPVALFIRIGRFDWRATLGVRAVPARAYLAATLVILGGIPIGWAIAWVQTLYLRLPEELTAALQGILTADGPARIAWLLLVVAVTPAICEEVLFRGVLLRGLLRRYSDPFAIFVSSAIFGVFHLSFETVIRLFPAMFLGALVGLVAIRTRSILPSMMMHFLNNGTAVLLVSTPALQRVITGDTGGPNPAILLLGLLLLFLGLRTLRTITPPDEPRSPRPAPASESPSPSDAV